MKGKKKKRVPLSVREEIVSAWRNRDKGEKLSFQQLGTRFGVPKATVFDIIRKFNRTGSVKPVTGKGGRRMKLSASERGLLARLAAEDPAKSSRVLAREFNERSGKAISARLICTYLKIGVTSSVGGGREDETRQVSKEEVNNCQASFQEEDFGEEDMGSGPASPLFSLEEGEGILEEMGNCFLCNSTAPVQDAKNLASWEDDDITAQFTWRRLLEIPEGQWREYPSVEGMRLCGDCGGEVITGRDLYRQLEQAAKQFRAVQERLISRILEGGREEAGGSWRRFVKSRRKQFSRPLVIGGDVGVVMEATVKQEVDEDDGEGNHAEDDYCGGDFPSDTEVGTEDSDGDLGGNVKTECSSEEDQGDASPPIPSSVSGLRRSTRKRQVIVISDECEASTRLPVKKMSRKKKKCVGGKGRNPGWSSCEICDESVKNAAISEHVRNHVGEDFATKCPNSNCPLVFSNSFARRRHVLENSCRMEVGTQVSVLKSIGESEHAYLCQECGVSCRDIDNLQDHLTQNHEATFKNLKCPLSGCQERFGVGQSVQVHLFEKHDLVKRALSLQKCAICSERLWVEDMESHLRSNHDAIEMITCSHCPHLLPSREYLIEHLYQAHRQSTSFTCDICSSTGSGQVESFECHIYLREHYLKEHGIGTQFVCELCHDKKAFWKRTLLENHQKRFHEGRPRFTCDICEAVKSRSSPSFPNQLHLQGHKIREHGLKPFLCDTCGDGFGSADLLRKHKLIHTGERPFVCPQCGQQFRQLEVLGRHLKAHAEKGDSFRAKGPMKQIRKRVQPKNKM